jgi:hypothetical protein
VRHIGVLMPLALDDPVAKARIAAFRQSLQQSGWIDGTNVQIDARSPKLFLNRFNTTKTLIGRRSARSGRRGHGTLGRYSTLGR